MPTVQRLLRGDERIGWELRLAHDLAADPSQYEPAAMMFARCVRAVEAGGTALAWSAAAAAAGAPLAAQLDVHSIAALANPSDIAAPWLRLGTCLLASGRASDGFDAACHGMANATRDERPAAIAELSGAWRAAEISTPMNVDAAFDAGLAAASEDRLDLAIQHLRWAQALDPANPKRAHSLAVALGRAGRGTDAIRVLAHHERNDAPRLIGRVLVDSGREIDAVAIMRYASRRFRSAEDWASLAIAAATIDNDPVALEAGRRAMAMGARDPQLLVSLATSMYRVGEFVDCENVAQQLISESNGRESRMAGLHAMARALAGQGRHVDAHPYAKAAAELQPNGELAAELMETMDRIIAQQTPPVRASLEMSMERQAFADLEAGNFEMLVSALSSPSWGISRVALAASEFRKDDESGIPVAPRALDAAVAILGRTEGATQPDAVLARIRALRIRDNAFIQIDPPPPLGLRYSSEEFERAYAERDRRPARASAIMSIAR
jgi:tetratricopeptide (TPR) repeat protein